MPDPTVLASRSEDLRDLVSHASNNTGPTHGRGAIHITPEKKWQLVDWDELIAYRDLFWLFVLRDVTVRYKQTVLGFGWAVLRPLISMIVMTIVFGRIAGIQSDGVPYALFAFTGLLPWTYFSTSLTMSSNSLVTNAHVVTKVYFPRVIIPAAPTLGNLVDLAIASIFLLALMGWYGVMPTVNLVFLPLLIVLMMITTLGAGLWLSALAIQYRDVNHAMHFVIQLGMYAAPVAWPVSLISGSFGEWGEVVRLVYGLYPLAGIIEGFRSALIGSVPMPWDLIGIGALSATVTFVTGLLYFKRMERVFADVA